MTASSETLLTAAAGRRIIVFDMDDTLMEERSYLAAGFAAVARRFCGDGQKQVRTVAAWMLDQFTHHGRAGLFELTRAAFPELKGSNEEWLEALRTAEVFLPIQPWVASFCAALPGAAFAILTNGNAAQQRNKYRQLQPPELRDRMRLYCAAESKPKPSPAGLWRILEDYDCPQHAALMIGESENDMACAAAAGVDFALAPPVKP